MKKIIFAYGRMNPVTVGHFKLIRKVHSLSRNADHMIFLSHTQNSISDPLGWNYKLNIAKLAFPGTHFCEDDQIKTPFQALEYIALAENYSDVTFVVGGDRIKEFTDRMTPYAREWGIKSFRIVSAGARNPGSKNTDGISGTQIRQYAYLGEESSFCAGLPNTINTQTKKKIFYDIRNILKIK